MSLNTAGNSAHENSSNMMELMQVLFRHKVAALVFFAAVLLGGIVYLALIPDAYTSEAKLMVRRGRESVMLDPTAATGEVFPLYKEWENEVNSELEILGSRELAEELVDDIGADRMLAPPKPDNTGMLGLIKPALFKAQWALKQQLRALKARLSESTAMERTQREKAVEIFERNLHMGTRKKSDIIFVTYTALDPELAQDVVNRLIELYLQKRALVHRTPGAYEFFNAQTGNIRDKLQTAEGQIKSLKDKVGIIDLEQNRRALMDRAEQLSILQLKQHAEQAALQARVDKLQKTLKNQAQTGGTAAVHMTQEEYRELQSALRSAEADLAAIEAETREVDRQLSETEAELKRINEYEFELQGLQREKNLLEDKYRQYSENLEQTRINAALEENEISNISMVQTASFPLQPNETRKKLKFIFIVIVAAAGGLGLALLAGSLDRAVYTPGDLARKGGVRELATIPALSNRERRDMEEQMEANRPRALQALSELKILALRLTSGLQTGSRQTAVIGMAGIEGGEGARWVTGMLACTLYQLDPGRRLLWIAPGDGNDGGHPAQAWKITTREEGQFEAALLEEQEWRNADSRHTTLQVEDINRIRSMGSFDVVLVAMPAFTARPDLLRLAAATDRIALVVQAGKTALAGMRKANALLNETASTVMGAILNQYREYVPGSLGEHV
jgi:uncharacterized protein involved in exopolysaccharide biosynthesis